MGEPKLIAEVDGGFKIAEYYFEDNTEIIAIKEDSELMPASSLALINFKTFEFNKSNMFYRNPVKDIIDSVLNHAKKVGYDYAFIDLEDAISTALQNFGLSNPYDLNEVKNKSTSGPKVNYKLVQPAKFYIRNK